MNFNTWNRERAVKVYVIREVIELFKQCNTMEDVDKMLTEIHDLYALAQRPKNLE